MERSEQFTKWRNRIAEIVTIRGGAFHRKLLSVSEQVELENFFRDSGLSADAFSREVGLKSHQLHNFLFCRRRAGARKTPERMELRRVVLKSSPPVVRMTTVRIATRGGCSVELPTVLDAVEFVRALEPG